RMTEEPADQRAADDAAADSHAALPALDLVATLSILDGAAAGGAADRGADDGARDRTRAPFTIAQRAAAERDDGCQHYRQCLQLPHDALLWPSREKPAPPYTESHKLVKKSAGTRGWTGLPPWGPPANDEAWVAASRSCCSSSSP